MQRYEDNIMVILNPWLIEKQKCTEKDIVNIRFWHDLRLRIFANMQHIVDNRASIHKSVYRKVLRAYARVVEKIEFKLQDAWHFERDRTKHSWWYQVPGCTCPKKANGMKYATGESRSVSRFCVIHGKEYDHV